MVKHGLKIHVQMDGGIRQKQGLIILSPILQIQGMRVQVVLLLSLPRPITVPLKKHSIIAAHRIIVGVFLHTGGIAAGDKFYLL